MPGSVFVITELYYPEETSTGHLLTYTAEGMARSVPVRVICSQPTYSARGIRAPERELRNGVEIERCAGTTLDKDSLWRRAINAATISISVVSRVLLRLRAGDVALVVTNPPFLPFGVAVACRLRRARCVLLIHDVYPEVLTAAGMTSRRSALARMLVVATRWLYSTVDRIIVLGRDMEMLALRKLPVRDHKKVRIIPNWADDDIVSSPKGTNVLLQELGLTNKVIVQYAGNMGRTHGIETLVAASRDARVQDIHWLFIGSGAKKAWLTEVSRNMENITILGNRPRSDQGSFLNACDVAIISFVPGMAGVSVPSRMYNIMAAGKPIIAVCDPESELAQVVSEEDIGWVVPPGDVERLVLALDEVRNNPASVMARGLRARHAALTKYSLVRSTADYVAVMRELLSA